MQIIRCSPSSSSSRSHLRRDSFADLRRNDHLTPAPRETKSSWLQRHDPGAWMTTKLRHTPFHDLPVPSRLVLALPRPRRPFSVGFLLGRKRGQRQVVPQRRPSGGDTSSPLRNRSRSSVPATRSRLLCSPSPMTFSCSESSSLMSSRTRRFFSTSPTATHNAPTSVSFTSRSTCLLASSATPPPKSDPRRLRR